MFILVFMCTCIEYIYVDVDVRCHNLDICRSNMGSDGNCLFINQKAIQPRCLHAFYAFIRFMYIGKRFIDKLKLMCS